MRSVSPRFSSDGSIIFGGSQDGWVYAYDARTLTVMASFECKKPVHSIGLNDSEEVLVCGCEEGQIYLFSLPNVRYDFHNTGFMSHVTRKVMHTIEDSAR
jgi:hypothetical protein